jgi:large subunit ribosomal protein L3
MKFIIGKKLGMTQIWQGDKVIPVTKVSAGPCVITQVKNVKKDGYTAVQIGYGEKKAKKVSKPLAGHLAGLANFRYLKEFRTKDESLQRGNTINISTFAAGDIVNATGFSKGKGFQGVVKRHGFHGHPTSHGTKDAVRMPGSIGATGPAHVFKGMRMGGHMGDEQVTTKNLKIVQVDEATNILYIRGAVPGATNGLVYIQGVGDLKIQVDTTPEVKEVAVEVKPEEKIENEKKDENIEEVVIEADEKIKKKEEVTAVAAEVKN